jgi:uncharacterized protein (TIGR03382 family)
VRACCTGQVEPSTLYAPALFTLALLAVASAIARRRFLARIEDFL